MDDETECSDQRLFCQLTGLEPSPGRLLIAAPDMQDPNFSRSLIYIVEHDETGTLGVVLTKRSEMAVHNILPAWSSLCAAPPAFFIGGPVKPDTGLCIAVVSAQSDVSSIEFLSKVDGRVHVVDLDGDPARLVNVVEGMRVFVGYTGWSPLQLAEEISRGDWLVAPGLPSDIIAPAREDLWTSVLGRQAMPLPLYATYTVTPEMN